jgi:hypothetical protein
MDRRQAVSHNLSTILLVAITILLVAMLALLFHMPQFNYVYTPSFLEINRVFHVDEQGRLNYDSRVVLFHNGTMRYENDNLNATFFRNGVQLPCVISTLNGYKFVSTHHLGVQTMGGMGCSGSFWEPHARIAFDFTDNTFRPGDTIRVDIYSKSTNRLISRFSCIA